MQIENYSFDCTLCWIDSTSTHYSQEGRWCFIDYQIKGGKGEKTAIEATLSERGLLIQYPCLEKQ